MPDADITNMRLPRTWVTAQPNNPAFDISKDELDDDLRILGDVDFGANKIGNVLNPTLAQDVATKNYVDTSNVQNFFDTAGTGLTSSGSTVNAIGTASRISVSASAIDIDSGYVGQASITTLGTISTGTWEGTAVATGFIATTLTGKTLTTATIDGDLNTILDINETQQNVSVGASGTVLTSNGVGAAPTYQASGAGDMILASVQTSTGKKTFQPDATNAGINVGSLAGDPSSPATGDIWYNSTSGSFRVRDTGASVTMVTTTEAQTLANKSLALGSNTITGSITEFNTALQSDTFVTPSSTSTFTNKTFDANATGNALSNIDIADHSASGTPSATTFYRGDNTWSTPAGSGDMVLADAQTVTGAKTFADDAFLIQNPAITFEYLFQGGAIVADRTITLPVLTGNDTLVFEAHIQTLTNKTIDGDDNTIVDINETQMNVSTGASGTVLTSTGAGAAPTYQASAAGEANTIASLGGGTVLTAAVPKSGVQLQTVSIASTAPINHSTTTDLMTFVLSGTTAEFDTALESENFAYVGAANTFTGANIIDNATGLTFNNQGAGIDPILFSNAASQKLNLTGLLSVGGVISSTITDGSGTIDAERVDATPSNNDVLGNIRMRGPDSAQVVQNWGRFVGRSKDVLVGQREGRYVFQVMRNDVTNVSALEINNNLGYVEISANFNLSVESGQLVDLEGAAGDTSIRSTGDVVVMEVGAGGDEYTFSPTTMDVTGASIINATIDGDLNTLVDVNETQMNVSVGAATTVLTSNGVGSAPTYAAPAGGEFTAAWTADHNQGGSAFGLRDALFVDPTVTTKKIQLDLVGMTAAVTAILDFNFTTAKTITFPDVTDTLAVKGANIFTASQDLNGNNLDNFGQIQANALADAIVFSPADTHERITSDADIQINFYAGDVEKFRIQAGAVTVLATSFNLAGASLDNFGLLQAQVLTDAIVFSPGDTDERIESTVDAQLNFFLGGGQIARFSVGLLDLFADLNLNANFMQAGEIVDPAAGTNSGKFYVKDVGSVSKPFFIGDGQAAVDLTSGGGSITFTDAVLCTLEVPEGTVAFPDVHALVTAGTKVTGFVLPDGASTSTINFKCRVPRDIASTPAMKIRVRFMTQAADSDHAVRLTVSTIGLAVNENFDAALTAETEITAECPNAIETGNEATIEVDLTTDWAADDTVLGQLKRDPTDGVDDYAGDILIVGIELLVDRTIS